MVRFRHFKGFTELKSREARIAHGQKVVEEFTDKLKKGWTPFHKQSDVIYTDSLAYQNINQHYNNQRKTNRTFNYYANKYLQTLSGLRTKTLSTYKSKFRVFQAYLVSKKMQGNDVFCFSNQDAINFREFLRDVRKLGNKSLNGYGLLMKAFFNFLIKQYGMKGNPFDGFKRLKVETEKPKIYTPELLTRMMEAARNNDPQMALVFQIIYNCFIRPKELRFLKIENIDFVRSNIRIPANIAKDKQERVVDIPHYILEKMKNLGFLQIPSNYFITSLDGAPGANPVGENYYYNHFVRLKKIARIPKGYVLYAFKHTGMVDLKLSGADWLDIKNQAGHESLDQTIEYTMALMAEGSQHIREKAPRI